MDESDVPELVPEPVVEVEAEIISDSEEPLSETGSVELIIGDPTVIKVKKTRAPRKKQN